MVAMMLRLRDISACARRRHGGLIREALLRHSSSWLRLEPGPIQRPSNAPISNSTHDSRFVDCADAAASMWILSEGVFNKTIGQDILFKAVPAQRETEALR